MAHKIAFEYKLDVQSNMGPITLDADWLCRFEVHQTNSYNLFGQLLLRFGFADWMCTEPFAAFECKLNVL
jgi:hypothetical protein